MLSGIHFHSLHLSKPALHFLVFAVIALVGFQLFPVMYPPLVDLPNHLARHAIGCDGGLGQDYLKYYSYDLRPIPNLAADLVYSAGIACKDIFLTNRLLIQFTILNLVFSVYVLHFAIWRKTSLWPVAATLLVYNTPFTYGFENFSLAAPFGLYLFAIWITLSGKPAVVRLAIVAPLAFALYFLHIIAFGFFILLVAAWELGLGFDDWKSRRFRLKTFLTRGLGTLLLALPAALHFSQLNQDAPRQGVQTVFSLFGRIEALVSLVIPRQLLLLNPNQLLLPLTILLFFILVVFIGFQTGKLRIRDNMKSVVWLVFLVALLMPATMSDIAFVQIRYPYLVAGVFIAATRWEITQKQQAALVLSILVLFALRTGSMKNEWIRHDAQVRELLAATESLPAGASLFPLVSERTDLVIRQSHSISYIGLNKDIFLISLFNGTSPLVARPETAVMIPQQFFPPYLAYYFAYMKGEFDRFPLKAEAFQKPYDSTNSFRYLLVLGEKPIDPAALPEGTKILTSGSFFTILETGAF